MGGTFGKSGSLMIDHTMDNIPMSRMDDENLRHGSILTVSSKGYPSPHEDPASIFESKSERTSRRRSLLVAYVTMFVMSIGFSIVLTGVFPYMQTLNEDLGKEYVGWVVAANPMGQVIAAPILGIWGNKTGSIRIPCMVTVFFFIIGNAMYSMLPALSRSGDMASYYGMIASRFIVGVSSANITLTRSYVAGGTTLKERTIGLSIIAAAQALGFVVGPVIQAALTALVPGDGDTGIWWLRWDKYTSCSWVAAAMGLINLVILLPCVFQEYNIAAKEMDLMKSGDEDLKLPKPNYVGICGILFSNFIALFIFTLIETLAEPLVQDEYGWTNDEALVIVGISLAGGGIVSVAMFSLTGFLTRKYDERKVLLILGFPSLIIGSFLLLPWGDAYMAQKCENRTTTDNMTTIDPTSTYIMTTLTTSHSMSTMSPTTIHSIITSPSTTDMTTGVSTAATTKGSSMVNIYEGGLFFFTSEYDLSNRATLDPEVCTDFGCPYAEQEWCKTIPQLPLAQLGVGFFIIMLGYPVCQSISQAVYSKMLGPKPQGLWMGILTGVGGLSRILGPIFVSNVYTFYGTYLTFGVLTGAMVIALVELLILYKKLVPMKIPSKSEMYGHDGPAANEKY